MEKDSLTNVVKVDFKQRTNMVGTQSCEMVELNQKKRIIFDRWLGSGTVCVLFDARLEGVKVPAEFQHCGDLRLNFCHDFQVADFNYNESAIWGTLSFDSGDWFCLVPWSSVYGLQSAPLGQGAVWFEFFPKDYDQVKVLGFSEEMCENLPSLEEEESKDRANLTHADNVVELDFSR